MGIHEKRNVVLLFQEIFLREEREAADGQDLEYKRENSRGLYI